MAAEDPAATDARTLIRVARGGLAPGFADENGRLCSACIVLLIVLIKERLMTFACRLRRVNLPLG